MQLSASPMFTHPAMDELYHDQWAQSIASGAEFVNGPYFRAPLYPAFLGTIYRIFGHDYLTPRLVQAALGSLSCGLVFLVGRSVFSRGIAAVAAVGAASYWMLIYYDGELLIPSLIVFLDLLLLLLLLHASRRPSKWAFAFAGVGLGLSAIARPNVLLFAPVIVVWILLAFRQSRRRAVSYATSVFVGCVLMVLPITARNYVIGDDLVLISSQGGVNFYIGNNERADGHTAIVPGTPGGWWEGYYATVARAERDRGRTLKPSEVSQYYYASAWRFIRDKPTEAIALFLRKLRLFWSREEISNQKGIYFWTEQFTPVVSLLPLSFGIVGPLGIVGLTLCYRRRIELFPLWGFVLVYMVSVVLFFCNSRYRLPVVPPLILLATYASFEGAAALRFARYKALLGGLAVLFPAVLLVHVSPELEDLRADSADWHALGIQYEKQGNKDRAMNAYRRALASQPDSLLSHYNLGVLLFRANRPSEAIDEFRKAVDSPIRLSANETRATLGAAHHNLGAALATSGAYDEAIEHFRTALELAPKKARGNVALNLARALVAVRLPEKAVETLEGILSAEPSRFDVHHELARLLTRLGRGEQAILHFREALRGSPDNLALRREFAATLAAHSRYSESAPADSPSRTPPNDDGVVGEPPTVGGTVPHPGSP